MPTAGRLANLAAVLRRGPELADELERHGLPGHAPASPDEVRAVVREELARAGHGPKTEGYLSVKRAAEYVGLTAATIREWCESGRLAAAKAGKQWRIRREDLDAALARPAARRPVDYDAEARRILRLDRERVERGG